MKESLNDSGLKVFVISLTDSKSRREKVTRQLDAKKIKFEFLNAIDGRTSNHPYLKNYNESQFLINRRRKAALGELGCYVSHLLAWEKCVALNEPIVVLEDDFELTDNFAEGLKFVANFADRVPFIRLEPLESKMFLTSYHGEEFSLVKQLRIAMCATGYMITPQGAGAFLKNGREIRYPIDLYLKYTFIHKQPMYALTPNIVYPTHANSVIGMTIRQHREKGVVLQIKRFIFKWLYVVGNTVTTLKNVYSTF